jgi:hypothetical protein
VAEARQDVKGNLRYHLRYFFAQSGLRFDPITLSYDKHHLSDVIEAIMVNNLLRK